MGIKIFSDTPVQLSPKIGFSRDRSVQTTTSVVEAAKDGNPNKYRYSIVKSQQVGSSIVVQIHYPDCFNHKGNKILVYDNLNKFLKEHQNKCIDPHFLEKSYSPIARFEPTERGWRLAVGFASMLKGFDNDK
jgi:hypothetical protein